MPKYKNDVTFEAQLDKQNFTSFRIFSKWPNVDTQQKRYVQISYNKFHQKLKKTEFAGWNSLTQLRKL